MRRWHGFGLLSAGLALLACSNDPAKEPNERRPTDLYVLKGVQYLENGRLDVAVEDLKHAIELDEGNAEAHNALGVAYERLNQADEAERQYQRALALDENHFAAANNYGRLLCAEGKYDQAMKRFQSVIDSLSYPTPWLALTNAGLCAKAQGLGTEAENYLRKALETNPNFAPALLEMAKLSLANRKYLSARAFLQRYESAAAPTPEALFLGLQIEQALGNGKDADAYRQKVQHQFPDSKEALRSLKSHASQQPNPTTTTR